MDTLATPAAAERVWAWLLDAPACVAVASDADQAADLFVDEAAAVAKAGHARQREFAMGRACARRALRALGHRPTPLAPHPQGGVNWPAGVSGSITHTRGHCCAVVGRATQVRGIGIDAEGLRELRAGVAERVCTSDELRDSESRPAPAAGSWALITFCAKEAVYKCCAPWRDDVLGFQDVRIEFLDASPGLNRAAFRAHLVTPNKTGLLGTAPLSGRWAVVDGYVLAAARRLHPSHDPVP